VRKTERVAVLLAVFLGGAILMALEVAGFRIIGRSFGSALRGTTTVIVVFLIAMSIGYSVGGWLADRWPRIEVLAAVLLVSAAFLLLIPHLDIVFTPRIASISLESFHAFLASLVLFSVPTMLLATVSPFAIRLFARDNLHSGRVAGAMSALSTVGSVAGSVLTAFVLIDWIGSIQLTVMTLGTAVALLALTLSAFSWRHGSQRLVRIVMIAAVGCILAGCFAFTRFATIHERVTSDGTKMLFERDSPYHHLRVLDRPSGERDLIIDTTLQTRMYRNDPNERGLVYEEYAQIARLMRPGLKRLLLIGLGGGTVAKQFTAFYPDTNVDAVEIDPLVVTAAEKYFRVQESPRLRVHVGDGRVFMKAQSEPYDLISIDAYTRGRYGSTIPPHLVTREFFQEVKQHLTSQGLIHFHCYAPRDSPFTRSLYGTIQSVFPSAFAFGETEIIASVAPLQIDSSDLMSRAGYLRTRLPFIDQRIATLRLPTPDSSGVPLLTDDDAPVDRLLRGR
jgi:spermidine synthase